MQIIKSKKYDNFNIFCIQLHHFFTPFLKIQIFMLYYLPTLDAGQYTFMDYVKVGLPLQILMGIVMVFVLPLIFPF